MLSFLTLLLWLYQQTSYIDQTKENWKYYYLDVTPKHTVTQWLLPFHVKNRADTKQLQVISPFGAPRESYLKGHIHTAIDAIPAKGMIPATDQGLIFVYPMAKGVICSIHLTHPHQTIVVKHRLKDGQILYTSYKHLQEIYVQNGQEVDENTKLARLYSKAEAKVYNGPYDHLHLEIRKSFADYGCASWLTMTQQELNTYFFEPASFIKKHMVSVTNQSE